jgi:hypothetical protein
MITIYVNGVDVAYRSNVLTRAGKIGQISMSLNLLAEPGSNKKSTEGSRD